MNKRLGATATLVAAVAAATGLFAGPSNGAPAAGVCSKGPLPCWVYVTATGPSPSSVVKEAGLTSSFVNTDSVTHTVVFANGLCSLTLPPGEDAGRGCEPDFTLYVGTYAYTVDGKFAGTVVTTAISQSVTLTARTHTVRHGTPLTLHGRISWFDNNPDLPQEPFRVIVLARRGGRPGFAHIAGGRVWSSKGRPTDLLGPVSYRWKLKVNPRVETTYVTKVTEQPPYAEGQIWSDAESRPFTVRIREEQR